MSAAESSEEIEFANSFDVLKATTARIELPTRKKSKKSDVGVARMVCALCSSLTTGWETDDLRPSEDRAYR